MGEESVEEGLVYSSEKGSTASSPTAAVVLSTIVAACGSLAYGFAVGFSSPTESAIMEDLGLSLAEYSTFGSILTFGGMLGALMSGRLADVIGRRGVMWLLEIFCTIGWLAIIFAEGAWWLYIGRLLSGVGAGLHCYVAPVYIAEIAPKNMRGAFTAVLTFTVTCGFSIMLSIGNFMTWRILALIGTTPCIVQIVGLFFIPESPRWLAKIGQLKKMEASLQLLRGKDIDISEEAAEIRDHTETLRQLSKSHFTDLFHWRYAHSLLVGIGLMVLVQFGGTDGISYYASSIFEAAGCSTGFATSLLAFIQFPFAAMSVFLMDKSGRRPLLMGTSAGACIGSFLAGLGFLVKDHHQWKDVTPILVMAGILMNSASFSIGMGGTPWVIMSEIFPINIKGSGGSLVTLSNWFSSWIVTYAFNFLFQWSSTGVFFVFALVCGSVVIFVGKLVPETKGRTLEEIQASMNLFSY